MIAVDGTQMTAYSVSRMMRQIKRLTVDRAIKSGFDDESVYKQDTGIVMDEDDVQLFHTLSDKLSEQKAAKKEKAADQKETVKKKTKVQASSYEELLDKLQKVDWNTVKEEATRSVGQKFDLSV